MDNNHAATTVEVIPTGYVVETVEKYEEVGRYSLRTMASHRISVAGSDISEVPSRSQSGMPNSSAQLIMEEYREAIPGQNGPSSAELEAEQPKMRFAPETLQVIQRVVEQKRTMQAAIAEDLRAPATAVASEVLNGTEKDASAPAKAEPKEEAASVQQESGTPAAMQQPGSAIPAISPSAGPSTTANPPNDAQPASRGRSEKVEPAELPRPLGPAVSDSLNEFLNSPTVIPGATTEELQHLQELKVLLAAEKALEEELLGFDANLLDKLPPAVARQLSARAIAIAAAESAASMRPSGSPVVSRKASASQEVAEPRKAEEFMEAPAKRSNNGRKAAPAQDPELDSSGPYEYEVSREERAAAPRGGPELYRRAVDWRAKRQQRFDEMKMASELEAIKQCTFRPQINKASMRLGRRQARKHRHPASSQASRADQGTEQDPAEEWAGTDGEDGYRDTGDSDEMGMNGRSKVEEACLRLYSCAMESMQKQRSLIEKIHEEEEHAKKAAVPKAVALSPAIYGKNATQRIERARSVSPSNRRQQRFLPSGMEECTFHPKTNRSPGPRPVSRGPRETNDTADLTAYSVAARLRSASAPPARPESRSASRQAANPQLEAVLAEAHELGGMASPATDSPRSSPVVRPTSAMAHALQNIADSSEGTLFAGEDEAPAPRPSDALDFEEFLQRQARFLKDKKDKVQREQLEQAMRASIPPRLSPGTRRILSERQHGPDHYSLPLHRKRSKADKQRQHPPAQEGETTSEQLGPFVRTISRKSTANTAEWETDLTFAPQITRRAQQRPARSMQELSEGDRLRRQCYLEQMRLEKLLEEEKALTFAPKINNYRDVSPRLSLRNPDLYLAQVRSKQQARNELYALRQRQNEEKELEECTFAPKIISPPLSARRPATASPAGYSHKLEANRSSYARPPSNNHSYAAAANVDQKIRSWRSQAGLA